MKIGAMAKATGTRVETIRYYEREGLLPETARSEGNFRVYTDEHVQRLAFIRHCRALDMPLIDVKRLLDFVVHPEADCGDINRLIDSQLERVRKRLNSMQALEKQLVALRAQCDENSTARECGILHELVVASHDEGCACHR